MIPGIVAGYPVSGGGGGDPYFSSVVLLTHLDGADGSTTFVDSSSYGRTITPAGGVQIDTANFEFGGASAWFNSVGDSLRCAQSSDFDLFGGDFTAEGWYYTGSNAGNQCVLEFGANNNNRLNLSIVAGSLLIYEQIPGGAVLITASAPPINTWNSWCMEKSGATLTLYINGAVAGTAMGASYPSGALYCDIGRSIHGAGGDFNGWEDEIRVTKGVARYGGAYTPKGPFPNF